VVERKVAKKTGAKPRKFKWNDIYFAGTKIIEVVWILVALKELM